MPSELMTRDDDLLELERLRAASRRALLRGDRDAWNQVVAEEFFTNGRNGELVRKRESPFLQGRLRWLSLEYDQTLVRWYGDIAIETGRAHGGAVVDGRELPPSTNGTRYTLVAAKTPARWLVVAHHASLVAADTPAPELPEAPQTTVVASDRTPMGSAMEDVRSTDTLLTRALMDGDAEGLEAIAAADLLMTDERGRVLAAQTWREQLAAQCRPQTSDADDVTVRQYGRGAVVTGRVAPDNGGPFRYLRAYVLAPGGWRLVTAHHVRVGSRA